MDRVDVGPTPGGMRPYLRAHDFDPGHDLECPLDRSDADPRLPGQGRDRLRSLEQILKSFRSQTRWQAKRFAQR